MKEDINTLDYNSAFSLLIHLRGLDGVMGFKTSKIRLDFSGNMYVFLCLFLKTE